MKKAYNFTTLKKIKFIAAFIGMSLPSVFLKAYKLNYYKV